MQYKRYITLFLIMSISLGVSIIRIAEISMGEFAQMSQLNSSMVLDVDTSRGYIYDCNSEPLVNQRSSAVVAAKPTARALRALERLTSRENFVYLRERASKGYPLVTDVISGEKSEDIVPVEKTVRYNGCLASHVIGYLNGESDGAFGIEKSFNDFLSGGERTLSVKFKVNAYGKVMEGEEIEIDHSDYYSKNGVRLTIDKRIQQIAEDALDAFKIECGAMVILDAKDGAIRAMASRPTFSADRLNESMNNEDSPFLNRAINAYNVGSVFKTVVSAAALESGISPSYSYCCTGKVVLNGVTFNCHERNGHGVLDMKDAIKYSCNTYFINLAQKLDVEIIVDTAYKMGYGRDTALADGFVSASGNLPSAESFDSAASVANFSFGQGELLATPLTVASSMLCVISDGEYKEPYLVDALVDKNLNVIEKYGSYTAQRAIKKETAEQIKKFLVYAGDYAVHIPQYEKGAGGKTATAQTGKKENGKEIYNTWYCGFFSADEPEYVITVFNEKGNSGSEDCLPVFEAVAAEINHLKK